MQLTGCCQNLTGVLRTKKLKTKNMKTLLSKLNPINWIENGIKKRIIRLALDFVESWIMRSVRYVPLRDYLSRLTLRLEDLMPFILSGGAVNESLKVYWAENKVELFKDQMTILRAILSEEVNDPDLLSRLDSFAADMEEYLKTKI